MTVKPRAGETFPEIVEVMQRLLGDGGCPWDREQSFTTLRKYAVEEAHEVVDAIDALGEDAEHPFGPARHLGPDDRPVRELREELGDLLLQVVFQAELARTRGWFGSDDVVAAIRDKMIRRHPHVFGDVTVSGTDQVLANWEKLKAAEKKDRGLLAGIPRGLDALLQAWRMGEKAANVGFDFPDAGSARGKLDEEVRELDAAVDAGDREAITHELGDVLFSAVNLARKLSVDPEAALRAANRRFADRFRRMEHAAAEQGRSLADDDAPALEARWQQAKRDAAADR